MNNYEKALKEVFAVTFGQSEEAMEMLKAEYEESDKSQSLESFAWWSYPINLGDCDYNLACRLFKNLMEERGYMQITNKDLHMTSSPFTHSEKIYLSRIGRKAVSLKWLRAQACSRGKTDEWVLAWKNSRKQNKRYNP